MKNIIAKLKKKEYQWYRQEYKKSAIRSAIYCALIMIIGLSTSCIIDYFLGVSPLRNSIFAIGVAMGAGLCIGRGNSLRQVDEYEKNLAVKKGPVDTEPEKVS